MRRRLAELEPFVVEYTELKKALAIVERVSPPNEVPAPTRRTSTSRRSSPRRGSGRTSPKKGAAATSRAEQFVGLVAAEPGITVAQAAKKMGMDKANALYTVARKLVTDGVLVKDGTGFRPSPST